MNPAETTHILALAGLALLTGLAGGALAALVRVASFDFILFAYLLRWNEDGKPLTCPVCMGGWSSLLTLGGWIVALDLALGWGAALGVWLAGAGVAAWLAGQMAPPATDLELPPSP